MRPIYAQNFRSATSTPNLNDLLGEPQPWMRDAACLRTDPEAFFPDRQGASPRPAIRVCRSCPVMAACLAYALSQPHQIGVWGGMSERARRDLRTRIRNEDVA